MLRIGILSDTHGDIPPQLYNFFKNCDEIWHAGDWGDIDTFNKLKAFKPLKTVWGNIDGKELRIEMPEHIIFKAEELKVLMIHIGGYPGKYSHKCSELIKANRPDVMVCGHSHILKVMRDKTYGLMHFNPGAAGQKGFHAVSTALRFEVNGKNMSKLEVWELPRKTSITDAIVG
ncbi:MAG: metallophosphoesterase family protein [Bacteroidia bacterium]|nr:metallophosphoesterase family protein [Bacteroidia bacterium]MBP9689025.1 metallophosphoesterase family protein [Bacteroidia bacterium]